jgi:hypothetical protein
VAPTIGASRTAVALAKVDLDFARSFHHRVHQAKEVVAKKAFAINVDIAKSLSLIQQDVLHRVGHVDQVQMVVGGSFLCAIDVVCVFRLLILCSAPTAVGFATLSPVIYADLVGCVRMIFVLRKKCLSSSRKAGTNPDVTARGYGWKPMDWALERKAQV